MTELIDAALVKLRENYVFPDKAKAVAELIQADDAAGRYADLTEPQLCERLTEQLYEVCQDRHLRVRQRAADLRDAGMTEEAALAAWRERLRVNNYGISRVERLDGNVGYLDLRTVTDPAVGAQAIAAAMELVSHTGALILDLRRNGGGSPDGAIFWCSYFFPDEETHLNSIYYGATGQTKQYWSLAWLPGRRYLDRSVYVLTSAKTFSGAEEIAYNLQAQKRATLIGETTRGGAHPTDSFPLSETVEITVPIARSVNPVTGTNWEGVGVVPEVSATAEEALGLAYRRALDDVIAAATSPAVVAEAKAARDAL